MKTLFITALLMSTLGAPSPAANPQLTGKWKIHSNTAGNESDATCTFIELEKKLDGACMLETGENKLAGTFDDKKVVWSYGADYNGTPITITYKGTLDPASMKLAGTVTVDPFGVDGDFSGVQESK